MMTGFGMRFGLLETAVRDQPERPLALTLFRATRRTVMTDGQPQGQPPVQVQPPH